MPIDAGNIIVVPLAIWCPALFMLMLGIYIVLRRIENDNPKNKLYFAGDRRTNWL